MRDGHPRQTSVLSPWLRPTYLTLVEHQVVGGMGILFGWFEPFVGGFLVQSSTRETHGFSKKGHRGSGFSSPFSVLWWVPPGVSSSIYVGVLKVSWLDLGKLNFSLPGSGITTGSGSSVKKLETGWCSPLCCPVVPFLPFFVRVPFELHQPKKDALFPVEIHWASESLCEDHQREPGQSNCQVAAQRCRWSASGGRRQAEGGP